MKRYELKDNELQTALEKAFPGFGEALQAACDKEFNDEFSHVCVRLNHDGGIFYNSEVDIEKTAIRTKGAYDPYEWNEYPKVTPPEGVPMRVEYTAQLMTVFQRGGIAVFEDGHWYECTPDGRHKISQFKNGRRVVRFRPWDDEK